MDAFILGAAIGLVHFGGLWWTLGHIVRRPQSAMVALLSYVARMGVTLGGFYLLMDGDWKRLVVLTIGFTTARFALAAHLRQRTRGEVGHST